VICTTDDQESRCTDRDERNVETEPWLIH
jgi:hypothetical protein